jgi:CBS domain-containing protein
MTQIREIMTKQSTYINPTTTLQEAAKIMKNKDIGFLPVADNDHIVGVITDRDIVTRSLTQGTALTGTTVQEAMTKKCLYCYENDTVEQVSENMAKNQVRRLPVMNSSKRLVGIISLGDIATHGNKQAAGQALTSISKHTH